MEQPPGYHHPQFPNHVGRLKKSLYDLQQAPRSWFSRLTNKLQALGFQGSKADCSLFFFKSNKVQIFILIYVDDILITCSNPTTIQDIIRKLRMAFLIKDLGSLNFFLGIEAITCADGMYLTQRRYIADIL